MVIYREINRRTIRIELDWGEKNCVSWKAMLLNGKEVTSGVTCDDYGNLLEAMLEIEDMVKISMDIASGNYEYPITSPGVIFRGDRLRQLRHVRNISAKQVACAAGITAFHVYRLERGERPRVWGITVAKLALALNTSTDYLLSITDDPNPITLKKTERK